MSLTLGSAPFGQRPGGSFNFDPPAYESVAYFEDSPRWVRGELDGEVVVDSRRAKLLHVHGRLPVYYFPAEDVRLDVLEGRDALVAPEPAAAELVNGHVAVRFDALDRWFEESQEIYVHPRDPYHRVDVLPSARDVRVTLDGHELARSGRAHALFETGLPTRWYLPHDDVAVELTTFALETSCPYKGTASYWSATVGDTTARAIAWTYPRPLPEVAPIAGLVCFFNERVEIELDGERQERPRTQWSGDDWVDRLGPSA